MSEKVIKLQKLHPLQEAIADDPHRFRVIDCGRRWGKSVLAMREGFMMLVQGYQKTHQRQRGWVVAPTFPLVRENWLIAEELLKDAITDKKLTEMKMDFAPFGFLEFKSAERDDEGLRGAGLNCCYHPDTEILTENGWVKINKVKDSGLRVVAVDSDLNAMYVYPKNYIEQDYDGVLYHFKSRNSEFLVTNNHRIFVERRISGGYKTQRYERKFVTAEEFKPLVDFIPFRVKWQGIPMDYFKLPGIKIYENQYDKEGILSKENKLIPINDWLAFLGFWMAEGYCTGSDGGKIERSYRVGICQSETANIDNRSKIEELIKKLPFKWTSSKDQYRTSDKQLWNYLKQFGNSHTKFVPKFIKSLPVEKISIFLEWYLMGDGYFSQGSYKFGSVSKQLADDIQELIFKTGSNCSLNFANSQTSFLNGQRIKNSGIWKGAQILTDRASFIKKNNIEKIKYKGKVHCLEVKGNILVTRFNNKISLCGNCVVDEASRVSKKSWEQGLRPALADKLGRCIFISTPKGKNWFYDMYRRGQEENPEIKSWQYPTYTNPYFPKSEWETIVKTTPELILKQEYLADFLDDEASVFKNINKCLRGELEEPKADEAYTIGLDLGRTEDFTVAVVIKNSNCQVVGLYRQNQVDWSLQKQQILALAKKYRNSIVYIDSTGIGDPIEEDLRKSGLVTRDFHFTNQSKYELVEQLMVGIEQGLIGIPDCTETRFLIEELKAFTYEVLPTGRLRYSAPEGLHDDGVMALGLATRGVAHMFYNKKPQATNEPPRNSPAGLEKRYLDEEIERNNRLPRRLRKEIDCVLAFS